MDTILNQSSQRFKAIGLVNELNVTHEPCKIRVKDKDGNDAGVMDGERIYGKINLAFGGGTHTFDFFFNSLTSRGEDSKQWKTALSIEELNPTIGGDSSLPTSAVAINGRVSENRFWNSNKNEPSVGIRWNASGISTSKATSEDDFGCSLNGNFFIKSIANEVKDDVETGRLKVELVGVSYGADPFIINAIVDEDLADDFVDIYSVGDTAPFSIDVVFDRPVTPKKTNKFGKPPKIDTNNNSYSNSVYMIVGGDEPIEEPEEVEDEDGNIVTKDNGYISPKAMKMALKERQTKIDNLSEDSVTKTKKNKPATSVSDRKKTMGRGTKVASPVDDDFEEDPF